jgi:NO-binding membrane sensor protein with MHYT domain
MEACDVNTVLSTLLFQHDLRLVALAAVICFIASFAGLSLMHHARRMAGIAKALWLTVAAVAVGFGIWATHFVAMLAFAPGLTPGYDLVLTLASLAVAVAITGSGLWFVSATARWFDAALGGAMVGLGITAMHYVGMAAMIVGGMIAWDAPLVAASGLFGMVFSALAMVVGSRRSTPRNRLWGTALLTPAMQRPRSSRWQSPSPACSFCPSR